MTDLAPLFRPFESEKLKLKNRIVMAPMTRSFSPDGIPGDDVASYYKRRALNEVGLIITEGTTVDHDAAENDPNVPAFHGKALEGWAKVVDEVHTVGGKIMPQLWHTGMVRRQGQGRTPDAASVGPSGYANADKQVGEAASIDQIDALIGAFAQGASDAKRLGFDGIELHGAHGYLIDQFFWDATNKRGDKYGGALAERATFAADIVKAARAAVGKDFPIIIRLSQWKQQDFAAKLAHTPEDLETFLTPLVDAGVDLFHCSQRRYWEPEFDGSDLNFAGWTKKITGKPTISVGSVGLDGEFIASLGGASAETAADISNLLDRMAANEFDLIAVGRALLVDPEWVVKVRDQRLDELKPYTKEAAQELY